MNKKSNFFNSLDKIKINGESLSFHNINKARLGDKNKIRKLPISYKILLENLIRNFDGEVIDTKDINNLINSKVGSEIQFKPSRVLMQDYTGVPAVADLAAMRDSLKKENKDPRMINPLVPVSLIVDHSIIVDNYGKADSINDNINNEFKRNTERYQLLKWAQSSFKNFKVFPPGSGICHQINLEYLADVVVKRNNELFFDSVVGTDSHTTMINALSVLGWGVGGIEAESVMLGESITMLVPDVLGVKLTGKLKEGITATDLVLYITEKLREIGVVGKFVEFFGSGLKYLSLSERSTISNMAPEYGATCGIFPVDEETLNYLEVTGRRKEKLKIVELYSKEQGIWSEVESNNIKYPQVFEIKLNLIKSSLAGPKRPQDRINLENVSRVFLKQLKSKELNFLKNNNQINHGSVCIAAITSCTNTSNPSVMITAGLIAKKAVKLGIQIPKWVKTSLAPGSKVVEEYLKKSGLMSPLNKLGFNIVGYGCTTCIGNSGPLDAEVESKIKSYDLNVCSVISGNRNFEGRIHPLIKSNFLASPPLVMIYAICGKININLHSEPLANINAKNIYLKDLWPSNEEVVSRMRQSVIKEIFAEKYSNIFEGDDNWKKINTSKSETFNWSVSSTYIKKPPFLKKIKNLKSNLDNAKPLLILGDSVTTDHISPAGVIKEDSSSGKYLSERQIDPEEFNSFGARRGNHEVMVRGTFANIRIKNTMVDKIGGYTIHYPSNKEGEIYEIAKKYEENSIPLIVIAGKEYGTGSSRDWAAKGTKLLGVRVVLAESFERIHRSNLVGMGVLPLQFVGTELNELGLNGTESFDLGSLKKYEEKPNVKNFVSVKFNNKKEIKVEVISRIDTLNEINFFKKNGILPYVLDKVSQ